MKLSLISIIFLLLSCNKSTIKPKEHSDYTEQLTKIKKFAKQHKYNQDIAFMIDYSLHSGLPRIFIVDIKNNKILDKGLVCHGDCKGRNEADKVEYFSNTKDSNCTSLGFALVAERAESKWGKKYKYWLNGLEKTNSNMRDRVVVLHAWSIVPDEKTYPNSIGTSWGCPTVSIKFLDKLDVILKKEKQVLLYSFN